MKVYMPKIGFGKYEHALQSLGATICTSKPEECDGLLLPGGADIDPKIYGHENTASVEIDAERDRIELEAFNLFLNAGKPILGICRGTQLINAAMGGTLHQDIPNHKQVDGVDTLHPSHTTDETLIKLYGESFIINSSHHQCVDKLGDGLEAVQWSDDNIVEAIRHKTLPIFGVQWHPERLREPTDGWKLIEHWLKSL